MSRIGKKPIEIPGDVTVSSEGSTVMVKGPKGSLTQQLPGAIQVAVNDGQVDVTRPDDERQSRALHGLTRSLISNMVEGVTKGFVRNLDIVGVGYRAVSKSPSSIELMLGFSHQVIVNAPEGVTFVVPQPTRIEVHGIDKQLVGQVAANIRSLRKPEPYKGKGVRYAGEHVRRKAGKAGKK